MRSKREGLDEKGEKYILLPRDTAYTIYHKIRKPFTTLLTGTYFGYGKHDPNAIYVDIQGKRTLFTSNQVQILTIPTVRNQIEKSLTPETLSFISRDNKNKDIRIINPYNFNGSDPTQEQSWLLISKELLN